MNSKERGFITHGVVLGIIGAGSVWGLFDRPEGSGLFSPPIDVTSDLGSKYRHETLPTEQALREFVETLNYQEKINQAIVLLETASDAKIVDFGKKLRQIYEEGGIYVTADPTPETDDFRAPKGKFPGTMVVRNLEKYNGLKIEFVEKELDDPRFSAGDWAVRLAVDFDFARSIRDIVGEPTPEEIEDILQESTLTIGVQAMRSIDPSKLRYYSLFVPRQQRP